jgi:hypothetical protein
MSIRTKVCWQVGELPYIAAIDAGSGAEGGIQESAVFLATHQPQVLVQLPGFEAPSGQPVSEDALLQHFTQAVGDDPSITVLNGAVGSGKSHMVRWLHAKTDGVDGWHRVYVEKAATNLRGVLHTILEGMSGPVVNDLRAKLASVSATASSLDEAKTLIAQQLAYRMEFPTAPDRELLKIESDAREYLKVMLEDPVLSPHMKREGGAIHRISRIAFEGLSGDDDSDRDLVFSEADLPLQAGDLDSAAVPTQKAVMKLSASQKLRATAVAALNEELPEAKKAVFIGGAVDLGLVFDEVRRFVSTQGKELVLFIEDLVLLHGIDRELAQAFTVGRGKGAARCAMRVVIAVTDGYLSSGFATLNTRATHFTLNLDLDDPMQVPPDTSVDFVGRYYNALRLGREEIADRYLADGLNEDWLGNACSDCAERTECHEVFGVDSGGHGLYPLNSTAVGRLVRLVSSEKFDPREIIRHVIDKPLKVAARELPSRSFPSGQFAATLDLRRVAVPPDERDRLTGTEPGQRALSVRAYWDDTSSPNRTAIYEAFGLEAVGDSDTESPIVDPLIPPVRSSEPAAFREIDAWANESRALSAVTAREIRTFVFRSLIEHIRGGPFGLRVVKSSRKERNDSFYVGGVLIEMVGVRIPFAGGGGNEVKRAFEFEFDHSDASAVLFKAIIFARQTGLWPVDRLEALARLTAEFDNSVLKIARVSKALSGDVDPAVDLLVALDRCRTEGLTSAGEALESILREPSGFGESKDWDDWAKAARTAHSSSADLLERCAMGAKGEGGTSFADGAVLATRLGRNRRGRRLQEPFKGSSDFVDLQRRTLEVQVRIGARLWKKVDQQLEATGELLAPGVTMTSLSAAVRSALQQARTAGLLPHADSFDEMERLAEDVPDTSVATHASLLRRSTEENRSVFDLMPDRSDELQRLLAYCVFVDGLFAVVEAKLGEVPAPEVAAVSVVSAKLSLRKLADQLEILSGGAK